MSKEGLSSNIYEFVLEHFENGEKDKFIPSSANIQRDWEGHARPGTV